MRQNRITTAATLSIAALLALTMTSCSTNPPSQGSGDKTITVAELGDQGMRAVIPGFEKANPGVTVKVDKVDANSYQQILTTQLVGGTAPDVIRTYPGAGSNLSVKVAGDKHFFTDLGSQGFARSIPSATKKSLVGSDKKLYAIPLTTSAIGAIYNVSALKAAGLSEPATWPQLLDFCSAAASKGKVAFGLGLKDAWSGQLIPYALTATLVYAKHPNFTNQQESGSASFAKSQWKTAFEKYLQMNKSGCFNASPNGTSYSQVEDSVRKGNTLAMVSVSSEEPNILKGGPSNLQLSLAALPATDSEADTYLSATTGVTYSINAKSKNQPLAKKFLSYLMQPKVQAAYAADTGDAPAISGPSGHASQVDDLIAKFMQEQRTSSWPDQEWPNATVQSTHFDVVQAMFTGALTPSQALAKMDAAFKSSK